MRFIVPFCLAASLAVTGCSLSPTAPPSTVSSSLGAIRGNVHGGQQPVVNAHVYLFAAGQAGYGGSGIDPSPANTSISLLRSVVTGHADADERGYVLTGTDGSFSITGDYLCTAGQQVYLYAVGGNPGAGTNSAAGFLAILGTCPAARNFQATVPYIWMNEVTTVAAAYAFAGFASDATHVSGSNTTLSKTGIANAFANAANLADITTGSALATTPNGNGTVPQTTINSLANILAACVNASNTNPGQCPVLLANALSNSPTVTIPNDTANAAINIAHRPANAVATLFNLTTGIGAAFAPALPSTPVPNDFTLSLQFTGSINTPTGIAIDSSGNAWIANSLADSVTKLSSTGVPAPGSPFTAGLIYPVSIALESNDKPWVGNGLPNQGGTLIGLSTSGAVLTSYKAPTSELIFPSGIALTGSGDLWVIDRDDNVLNKYSPAAGSLALDVNKAAPVNPTGIAIDASLNAWASHFGNSMVITSAAGDTLASLQISDSQGIAIDNSGNGWVTTDSPSITKISKTSPHKTFPYTDNSLSNPKGIAIDGADNIWVANNNSSVIRTVAEFSDAGAALSGPTGYRIAMSSPQFIAIDGSGDVWVATPTGTGDGCSTIVMNYVTEIIGAATPVVTPLAAAVANNTIATRP